ncbi:Wzz/FepE/Etk N-terminal domain-containing protein [Marinomonas sp. THO17]|uniref:LPS O-antigen chain length determinant protein WzzB n=1 Tax=Marinomonas sp. THO17 TaxID=3149048 RepID=UPI00336BDCFE
MSGKVSIESQELSQYPSYRDDEIDLKELFLALWQGKWIVLVSTFMVTIFAIVYALMAQQKWTSEAVVTVPQPSDFEAYQIMVNGYQPLFHTYQVDEEEGIMTKLDVLVEPINVFKIFIQQYQSRSNKLAYLSSIDAFQEEVNFIQQEFTGDEYLSQEQKLYVHWASKLFDIAHETKKDAPDVYVYTLKGESDTDQDSFELLQNYIIYASQQARKIAIANLNSIVKVKEYELQQELSMLQDQAKESLEAELAQSRYALKITEAAGIQRPIENLGVSDLFPINIGANALAAKVKVLEELDQLSVLDPRLDVVNSELRLIERLKIDKNADFETFRFIDAPEKPLSRTSPNRRLIALLGVLLGGMLGCLIVLVRFAFRDK